MSLFVELKRRNVFRVGIAYVVTSWLILQVADIVLDNTPAPDWIMQVIMLLTAIGLPVALLFAWAFELTAEGIKKEKDVDRSQSITYKTGRRLDRNIIIALVIALSYFAWDKFIAPDIAESPSFRPVLKSSLDLANLTIPSPGRASRTQNQYSYLPKNPLRSCLSSTSPPIPNRNSSLTAFPKNCLTCWRNTLAST